MLAYDVSHCYPTHRKINHTCTWEGNKSHPLENHGKPKKKEEKLPRANLNAQINVTKYLTLFQKERTEFSKITPVCIYLWVFFKCLVQCTLFIT